MQKPEVPIIIIERDEQPQAKESVTKAVAPSKKQKWLKWSLALIAVGCLMIAVLAGYNFWNYYYKIRQLTLFDFIEGKDLDVSYEEMIEDE